MIGHPPEGQAAKRQITMYVANKNLTWAEAIEIAEKEVSRVTQIVALDTDPYTHWKKYVIFFKEHSAFERRGTKLDLDSLIPTALNPINFIDTSLSPLDDNEAGLTGPTSGLI